MHDDAQKIFDFLPIRRSAPENDYINHLWQAFFTLDEGDVLSRPFAVMPFHLLFMLSAQYKTLRIAEVHKQTTDLFFTGVGGRHREQLLSEQRSVFDMALVNERTLPDVFQLAQVDPVTIKKFKELVDERNDNLAHAKGGVVQDLERRLDEYIEVLDSIQRSCTQMNQSLADEWMLKIETGDDLDEFIESRLIDLTLSPRDFGDVVGILLKSEKLSFEQWEQVVNKGLQLAYEQTVIELKYVETINDFDQTKKSKVTSLLQGIGESSVLSLEEAQESGLI